MSQFDTALNNEGWIKGYDKTNISRSISQIFNESEKISKWELDNDSLQQWNELKANIQIIEKDEATTYSYKTYFEVDYGLIWWKHNRFINREIKKIYENWSSLRILDHCQAKIYYTKENKAQLKAKLKKYFDKVLNDSLIRYFNEMYLTPVMPAEVDTIKAELIHLKALGIGQDE